MLITTDKIVIDRHEHILQNKFTSLIEGDTHIFNLLLRSILLINFDCVTICKYNHPNHGAVLAVVEEKRTEDFSYPKSISVLSPIFKLLLSPRTDASLPISELSKTTSNKLV
jgi:hypothetical protein